MEDILGAIARDVRKTSGNERERVGIWLHVDDNHLFCNDVKQAFKLNEGDMLTNRRAYLSPALDVLASGWCYDNNIFFFPLFSGTNHFCLKELMNGIRHPRMRIQLIHCVIISVRLYYKKSYRTLLTRVG